MEPSIHPENIANVTLAGNRVVLPPPVAPPPVPPAPPVPKGDSSGAASKAAAPSSTAGPLLSTDSSLWALAYSDLRAADPELVLKFEQCLAIDGRSGLGPALQSTEIEKRALSKINEVNTAKGLMSGKSAKVRKYFEQTVKVILSSQDYISAAVAANPYAATAWTGVCFILPVRAFCFVFVSDVRRFIGRVLLNCDSCF